MSSKKTVEQIFEEAAPRLTNAGAVPYSYDGAPGTKQLVVKPLRNSAGFIGE